MRPNFERRVLPVALSPMLSLIAFPALTLQPEPAIVTSLPLPDGP